QLLKFGIRSKITFSGNGANIEFDKEAVQTPVKEEEDVELETETAELPKTTSTKKHRMNLIDEFLKTEVKIVPIKDYQGETTSSIDSLIEDQELFSEKLAKIYIKQKHYDKALKTYEKLCLKYPEKNIYFAVQIENLKRLINKE
ncbi:MAG: hypothetical protein HUK15_07165, partial [Bacteroidales bacterium]|nr:hypothetical protein [Bacteroidales bacterium]